MSEQKNLNNSLVRNADDVQSRADPSNLSLSSVPRLNPSSSSDESNQVTGANSSKEGFFSSSSTQYEMPDLVTDLAQGVTSTVSGVSRVVGGAASFAYGLTPNIPMSHPNVRGEGLQSWGSWAGRGFGKAGGFFIGGAGGGYLGATGAAGLTTTTLVAIGVTGGFAAVPAAFVGLMGFVSGSKMGVQAGVTGGSWLGEAAGNAAGRGLQSLVGRSTTAKEVHQTNPVNEGFHNGESAGNTVANGSQSLVQPNETKEEQKSYSSCVLM